MILENPLKAAIEVDFRNSVDDFGHSPQPVCVQDWSISLTNVVAQS
jgi:hypothetical protein